MTSIYWIDWILGANSPNVWGTRLVAHLLLWHLMEDLKSLGNLWQLTNSKSFCLEIFYCWWDESPGILCWTLTFVFAKWPPATWHAAASWWVRHGAEPAPWRFHGGRSKIIRQKMVQNATATIFIFPDGSKSMAKFLDHLGPYFQIETTESQPCCVRWSHKSAADWWNRWALGFPWPLKLKVSNPESTVIYTKHSRHPPVLCRSFGCRAIAQDVDQSFRVLPVWPFVWASDGWKTHLGQTSSTW